MSDQFIVKEVLDFTMCDFGTGEPILSSNYAMVSTNDNKATRIEVRGGQGNYLLGVVDHTKTSSVTLNLPLVDLNLIALLNGESLGTGIDEVFQRDVLPVQTTNQGTINVTSAATGTGNVTVTLDGVANVVAVTSGDSASTVAGEIQAVLNAVTGYSATVSGSTVTVVSNTPTNAMTLTYSAGTTSAAATANVATNTGVTLSFAPIGGTLKLYTLVSERDYGSKLTVGTPATTPNTYSVNGQQIALNTTSNPTGSQVVAIYQYNTSATAKTVRINASKFPKHVMFFGDGVWIDQDTGEAEAVKVTAFHAIPKSDITFTMEGTKATELQVVLDLIPAVQSDGTKTFMKYTVLQDE